MSDLFGTSSAIISDCGLYRYRLSRRWGDGPTCGFIMLNPSTADAENDDPTIRRCIGFAKRNGCGGLTVVNLFAFRATSPTDMKAAKDPVGPHNVWHIANAIDETDGPMIAGWGDHGEFNGQGDFVRKAFHGRLWRLALNKSGQPKHPLYIKADAELVRL